MDDLISRQAVYEILERYDSTADVDAIRMDVEDLSSAQERKKRWIPCEERLPEYDGEMYLVTDYCEQINRRRLHISYCYVNREGFWSDVPMGYKVVAWMPLPEPYKGEE